MGSRPNSVVNTTSVSSSIPRCFKSRSSAASGLSRMRAFLVWLARKSSWPSQLTRGSPKCPPLYIWTQRTPFSTSRRAIRQFQPKSRVAASLMPYISRVASDSPEISVTIGAEICMRAASSYALIRAASASSPSCSFMCSWLIALSRSYPAVC